MRYTTNRMILVMVTGIFFLFFAACATYKPLVPTQADAEQASKNFPGTTMADLMNGKTIFEDHCGRCHSRNKPFKKTGDQIKHILPRMAKNAKIDDASQDLVLKYLLTMTAGNNQ